MTIRDCRRCGRIAICAAAVLGGAAADNSKLAAHAGAPMTDTSLPTLQGDAALAELELRGEKASLMAAFEAARDRALPGSFTGPAYLKSYPVRSYAGNHFGYALAISGDTAVVGAPLAFNLGPGLAFVFQRRGAEWTLVNTLSPDDFAQGGHFGHSVAVSATVIVVGAPLNELVYAYRRGPTGVTNYVYLTASNPAAGDGFGSSVAASGNTVVVSAPGEDGGGVGVNPPLNETAPGAGAAYVFVASGSSWIQQAYLKASNTGSADAFGTSVAVSGDTVVIGAPGEDGSGTGMNPPSNENAANAGAAYVFRRTGASWSSTAYLKPSNPGPGDDFGRAVAASWNTLVVGAPDEDSGGQSSGAAYVFARNGSTWSQQAYLKAFNSGADDRFGGAVAISGNTAVVGAIGEGGSGIGVNPAVNEGAPGAGAAYAFVRNGTTWTHHAYLKASNTGAGDQFGYSVAVSGSAVFAGAPFEDSSGTYFDPVSNEDAIDSGAAYVFDAPDLPPLVYLNLDRSGDALLYGSTTGAWSRQTGQSVRGFTEHSLGAWAPGWSVLPANFNSDELTDFFLFNSISGAWSRVLTGESAFTTESSGTWWPGWQRYVMELNGDGISDVLLYDPISGAWFKCVSTLGGFTYTQGGWNPGWELHPMTLTNDGFDDLFLFNRSTGRWFWALGQNGDGFTYPATGTWFPEWQLHPGDFNGDDLTDLLLYHPATGGYFVATATASGFTYTQGAWSPGWTPYVADIDGDLKDDVFLHDESTGVWFEMISDGAGAFTSAGSRTWSVGWQLHFTDVNGDGRVDILRYNPSTGEWRVGDGSASGGTWAPGLTIVTRRPGGTT